MFRLARSVLFVCVCVVNADHRWLTVNQKLGQDEDLTQFHALLQRSKTWRTVFMYRQVTVLAPDNDAFAKFNGRVTPNLTNYHVVAHAYSIDDFSDGHLQSVQENSPPLWVKTHQGDIYINNALLLDEKSNFVSQNRLDIYGHRQALHVIDEVLDPVVRIGKNPTAYDLLTKTTLWTTSYSVKKFLARIIQNHAEIFFENDGADTFFIPIDQSLDEYRAQKLDAYAVKAHVVKNQVLFTRPTAKGYLFETLSNGDYICVLVSMLQENSKTFVISNTILGDTNHPKGEIKAEIILSNIPVRNGVVHLINRPLTIFDKKLTKFPYLPVFDKLSMDPNLNLTYNLGASSGFNSYLSSPKTFTFFIPRDLAWTGKKFRLENLHDRGKLAKTILERHLVLGDIPLRLERLVNSTRGSCVTLTTISGKICLGAEATNGKYVLKWRGRKVGVYRANYECSNGIVHVIDEPLLVDDEIEELKKKPPLSVLQLYKVWYKMIFG